MEVRRNELMKYLTNTESFHGPFGIMDGYMGLVCALNALRRSASMVYKYHCSNSARGVGVWNVNIQRVNERQLYLFLFSSVLLISFLLKKARRNRHQCTIDIIIDFSVIAKSFILLSRLCKPSKHRIPNWTCRTVVAFFPHRWAFACRNCAEGGWNILRDGAACRETFPPACSFQMSGGHEYRNGRRNNRAVENDTVEIGRKRSTAFSLSTLTGKRFLWRKMKSRCSGLV